MTADALKQVCSRVRDTCPQVRRAFFTFLAQSRDSVEVNMLNGLYQVGLEDRDPGVVEACMKCMTLKWIQNSDLHGMCLELTGNVLKAAIKFYFETTRQEVEFDAHEWIDVDKATLAIHSAWAEENESVVPVPVIVKTLESLFDKMASATPEQEEQFEDLFSAALQLALLCDYSDEYSRSLMLRFASTYRLIQKTRWLAWLSLKT